MSMLPLLSSMILCPFLGAVFILFFVKDDKLVKIIGLLSSLVALFISILILFMF